MKESILLDDWGKMHIAIVLPVSVQLLTSHSYLGVYKFSVKVNEKREEKQLIVDYSQLLDWCSLQMIHILGS